MLPQSLQILIDEFGRLPGVGPRTAERLAVYMLKAPAEQTDSLARALSQLRNGIKTCRICFNISENSVCVICNDDDRDTTVLAVVEDPLDVVALERTGMFRGRYHVLGGVISPLEGIGPDQLNIATLVKRIKQGKVKELIIATNPNIESEATALYLQKQLPKAIKITRLARGLPMGSDLEYADQITLGRALEGRQAL